MGLDQHACATDNIQNEGKEIAYWRKHNRLQGWMDALWHSKGNVTDPKTKADWGTSFNGQKLVLTEQDIDALELAIKERELPQTGGFFFGSDSYEYIGDDGNYEDYSKDIKFLEDARTALKEGKTVYYQCSW